MADEKIVEVKTIKTDPPRTSGIALLAVVMTVVMGLLIFAVKYSGGPTPAVEPTQSQIN